MRMPIAPIIFVVLLVIVVAALFLAVGLSLRVT
jgi:hypothetical protein